MLILKQLISVNEHNFIYAIYQSVERMRYYYPDYSSDPQVVGVSYANKHGWTLDTNSDTFHWVIRGYNGGDIYYGKTYDDCITFITKRYTIKESV